VTGLGRTLTNIFLALVYAILVSEPQAHAGELQAAAPSRATAPAKAAVMPAEPSSDPVIITELRWDGERLIVGSDRLLRFRSFNLREPDRVVVDLFDAELGDPNLAQAITIETDPIQKIRIGAHPEEGFLRVVIDCDRPVPVQITQPRGMPRLVIRLQGADRPEETPAKEAPAKTAPERQAPEFRPTKYAAEAYGPPEPFGPPASLRASSSAGRKTRPEVAVAARPEPATPTKAQRAEAQRAETQRAEPQGGKPRAGKTLASKPQETKTEEAPASRSVAARPGREEVGIQLSQSRGSTQLKLQGNRALRLKIQQAVDPARLMVQIPSGALKGKLPKVKGQIEALEVREEGDLWVLEARLPEGPLDIQNRLEDDGKTLVLAIQPQVLSASKRPLVLIDPGHGGDDPGALGSGGTKESDVNLAIALKLQKALQARGVNAVLTRTGDVSLDLAARARMIDQLGAHALVSVHANSHDASSALGLETYYRTTVSQSFAQQIHHALVSELQRPDRGVREARLFVLRHPTIPSALIEAGFISNPEEEGLLGDRDYQKRAAEAIAKGVAGYLSTPVAELSQ
jgi:N-acetylmuramoyl-L-alanine amidase